MSEQTQITYRIALEYDPNADRTTYEQRMRSLTDGFEASIRDAGSGSFESVSVSRTTGPYTRTMTSIDEEKKRIADYEAWLSEFGDTGGGWLSPSVDSIKSDLDDATESIEKLEARRERTMNVFVHTVAFAPKSFATVEVITSEFDRLSALDGVEAVEIESDAPDVDPRNSIDFGTPGNQTDDGRVCGDCQDGAKQEDNEGG